MITKQRTKCLYTLCQNINFAIVTASNSEKYFTVLFTILQTVGKTDAVQRNTNNILIQPYFPTQCFLDSSCY